MGAKICTSVFLRRRLLCSFKFSFVKVRKIKYRFVCVSFFYLFGVFFVLCLFCVLFCFLMLEFKDCTFPLKSSKVSISIKLGMQTMMHILPAPPFFFALFFPIVHSQLPLDTRTWLLLLNESIDTFLEAPFLPLSVHCCSLSFIKAAAENWVFRKDILPGIYS